MVKNPSSEDIPKLKKLWQSAFGENETVLDVFFRNVYRPRNTLIISENGIPISALYLLPCEWVRNEKEPFSGLYVYAVATDENHRGQGLAGRLLREVNRIAALRNLDFLFLVPSSPSLFEFYKRHGYTESVPTFTTTVSRDLLENLPPSPQKVQLGGSISYKECRQAAFSSLPAYISYPENHMLFSTYLYRQYGRKTITQKSGVNTAFAILEPQSETKQVFVKEIAQNGIPFENITDSCLSAFPDAKEFVFYHPKKHFPLPLVEEEQPLALFRYLKEALRNEVHPYVSTVLD